METKESNLFLKESPTLSDFQRYVAQMVIERGFKQEGIPHLFMLFMEEVGELAKAARKKEKLHTAPDSDTHDIGHEAADCLMYLLDICNKYDIDLETAFREKEEINKKRTWK